jgi:beta-fructofuranosidase
MIHWKHEPIALTPTAGGPDSDGVFSGSAVLDKGKVAVIYTGVAPPSSANDATLRDGVHTWRETQCLAVAQDDDLRIWRKDLEPVIAAPPAGLEVTGFRDPALWREGDKWMLILGSGVRGKGGMILLYTSTDLRHWTYLHPLIEGSSSKTSSVNPVDTGEMWECPDFFPLGDKHVLLISTVGKVRWKVGTYAGHRFTPEKEGVVDWGSYYAAKTMMDAAGRLIIWGWIPETRPDAELIAAGWAGVMSLPRVVSLTPQNELKTEAAPVVERIRGESLADINRTKTCSTCQHVLEALRIKDLAAEIEIEIELKADDVTLRLYSDSGDFVTISLSNKSGNRELRANKVTAPIPGPSGSLVRLHMFLDGSVLEIFANETVALTARVYQIPAGPLCMKLVGEATLISLRVRQMKSISKDRLAGDCALDEKVGL